MVCVVLVIIHILLYITVYVPSGASSASSSYSTPDSRGSSKTFVLQQRKSRATPTVTSQLQAYQTHAQTSVGMFHYQSPAKSHGEFGVYIYIVEVRLTVNLKK